MNSEFYQYLGANNLGDMYNYIMENNPGGNNPYHNNFHLENVARFALTGAKMVRLPKRETVLLVTSALWHDFAHYGGKAKSDAENVSLAIEKMFEYFTEKDKWLLPSVKELQIIKNNIQGTEFPYQTKGDELTLSQKILRDSDIVQGLYCQNFITQIVRALVTEMSINNPNLDFKSALNIQVGFYNNLKIETCWGQILFDAQLPEIIKLVEEVKSLYNSK